MIVFLLILACASAPSTSDEGAGVSEDQSASDAESASMDEHPGRITLVDLDTEETRDLSLDELPEGIHWEEVKGEMIPVVRIESRSMGSGREIIKYGPDGQLLSVTRGGSPRRTGASP